MALHDLTLGESIASSTKKQSKQAVQRKITIVNEQRTFNTFGSLKLFMKLNIIII